ncbi:unnamed protein product [Brachionus calyciflorus]|uniref:Uncharacterized protein n=1 Tax=Brachionus calyciflorus TaxID=104777 RepID=A0A814H784_9BILA|nr:unnamed protein product [Brachionus calyciflorus]
MPNLETLYLFNNNISKIDLKLKNLIKVDLNNNKLKEFPYDLFLNSLNLIDVNLSNNEIQEIKHIKLLPEIKSLRSLNLAKNKLKEFPYELSDKFCQLKSLIVTSNEIIDFDAEKLKKMDYLNNFYIAHNKIARISDNFSEKLPNLNFLDLTANCLSEINQEAFKYSSKLKFLFIRKNSINQFPFGLLEKCLQLTVLDLSDNKITSIDQSITLTSNLANLSLSEFPYFLGEKCTFLDTLDLSENEIIQIDEINCEALQMLGELCLNKNKLKEFPHFLTKICPQLKQLHLRDNEITKMSLLECFKMQDLYFLDLNNNKIYQYPNDLDKFCPNLTRLILSNNFINPFDARINSLEYMENIDVSFNVVSNDISFFIRLFECNDYEFKEVHENDTSLEPRDMENNNKFNQLKIFLRKFNKVPKQGEKYFVRKFNFDYKFVLYFLYRNICPNMSVDFKEFQNLVQKFNNFEYSFLDFLVYFSDFHSNNLILLKRSIETLIEQSQSNVNKEFNFFSPESIVSICKRNDTFLLETFFPNEHFSNQNKKLFTKFIPNDLEFFSLVNFIVAFEIVLNNQNEDLVIQLFSLLQYSCFLSEENRFENVIE